MGAQYVDDGLHFGTRRGPRAARPFINKKRKKTKRCGGRPRSIRKQIGQVDGAVWARNMSTTGCFLGRAAGRAQRGPLLIKKKEDEEMRRQAMIDP